MNSLDYCCLVCLVFSTAHGAWRGWTAQGFYCLMAFSLYAFALKISTGHYTPYFFPDADISFRSVLRLEIVSPLVVIFLFLLRRFHNQVFITHKSVPGHHVAGAFFGFLTGFFGLLYLIVWINFTDLKTQDWWTSSLEYELSQAIPELIKIVVKTLVSEIT